VIDNGFSALKLRIAAARAAAPPLDDPDYERKMRAAWEAQPLPLASGVEAAPGKAGSIGGLWLRARGSRRIARAVYVHGGGYTLGSPHTHAGFASRLVLATGFELFCPDYRLAPEHRFPAAYDDVRAAALALPAGLPLFLLGDSAGAGAALSVAAAWPAEAQPLTGIIAFSPWTDLSLSSEAFGDAGANDPVLAASQLRGAAAKYLGGANPLDGRASPLFAEAAAWPPLLLHACAKELLLEDSTRLAERVAREGGDVSLLVWDGALHAWFRWIDDMPDGARALAATGQWISQRLAAHG
jgi:acetyl esterase/lipase